MRGGRLEVVIPGSVRIDLMFNQCLCCCFCGVRVAECDEKVEKEIDFGPDCRDKLAKALKDGIERHVQRAKRKQVKGCVEKGGTNAIPAVAK